jgi:hypothetical protein
MALAYPLQGSFRDEEAEVMRLVRAFLAGEGITATVVTETPDASTFNSVLPIVRLGRVGGAPQAGSAISDRPVVDVDVLSKTRAEAKRIAQRIEQFLRSCPHPIDSANVLMSPQKVEWQEGSYIRRMYASYHLSLRR